MNEPVFSKVWQSFYYRSTVSQMRENYVLSVKFLNALHQHWIVAAADCFSDFQDVDTILGAVCGAREFQVIFLPKFYCELNFIE
jgi:hypothetical protein